LSDEGGEEAGRLIYYLRLTIYDRGVACEKKERAGSGVLTALQFVWHFSVIDGFYFFRLSCGATISTMATDWFRLASVAVMVIV